MAVVESNANVVSLIKDVYSGIEWNTLTPEKRYQITSYLRSRIDEFNLVKSVEHAKALASLVNQLEENPSDTEFDQLRTQTLVWLSRLNYTDHVFGKNRNYTDYLIEVSKI